MEIITIYRANDGTEFANSSDCLEYEDKIAHLPKAIHFYDEYMRPLIPSEDLSIEKIYNNSCVLEIEETPKWREDLKFMVEYWGFLDDRMTPGKYKYDESTLDWVKI